MKKTVKQCVCKTNKQKKNLTKLTTKKPNKTYGACPFHSVHSIREMELKKYFPYKKNICNVCVDMEIVCLARANHDDNKN